MLKRIFSEVMLTLLFISMLTLAFNIQPVKSAWTGTVYIRADGSIDPPDAPIQRSGDVYTLTGNITANWTEIRVERDNIIIDGAGYTIQGKELFESKGIDIEPGYNVSVYNCNIRDFAFSVLILNSDYCNVSNSYFVNCGLFIENSYHNVVVNNFVNGKPLVYLEHASDVVVEDAGQVILINCTRIRVENLTIHKVGSGIYLWDTNNTLITRNNITECELLGIRLYGSCSNNTVSNNYIKGSIFSILPEGNGKYNTINSNHITNSENGILLVGSHNNSINCNKVEYCSRYGISLFSSSNNTVSSNCLTNNFIDLYLSGSSHLNKVYHNSFLSNSPISVASDSINNTFDDGYPSGGNYWSDYNGTDLYSGPYQNETGSDSRGDTPYSINENNIDRYPLMGPWTEEGENITVLHSSGVSLTFENVTSNGVTTVNKTETDQNPPVGFKLLTDPPLFYDIETAANYSGTIVIGITYDDTNLTLTEEKNLKLMQWNETSSQWVNITTHVDTENNVVYGETTHLCLFTLMKKLIGDVDWDGDVDIYDVVKITSIYGSMRGDPKFNPNCDLNDDEEINICDVVLCTSHYGETYP